MSGEHTKREMITSDKPKASGRKNDERTPSKEADDKHKEESASSIKSQEEKENEEDGLVRDRLFITFHIRRRVYILEAPRAQEV
jgi:hypothetical protein